MLLNPDQSPSATQGVATESPARHSPASTRPANSYFPPFCKGGGGGPGGRFINQKQGLSLCLSLSVSVSLSLPPSLKGMGGTRCGGFWHASFHAHPVESATRVKRLAVSLRNCTTTTRLSEVKMQTDLAYRRNNCCAGFSSLCGRGNTSHDNIYVNEHPSQADVSQALLKTS